MQFTATTQGSSMFNAPATLKFKTVAAVAAAFLLIAGPALAGQYELVKGKGVEVCEAYEKSLNSFQSKLPMVCGRPANADQGFSKPKWERPATAPNGVPLAEPYWDFSEFLWKRDVNRGAYFERDKWKDTPAQNKWAHERYEIYRDALWKVFPVFIANFDIDNDGKPEHVYFERACGSAHGDFLAVLAPDYKTIDRKKTELVMPHPPFAQTGFGYFRPVKKGDWGIPPDWIAKGYAPVEDSLQYVHYDAFFYKSRTYFDQWWVEHPDFHGKSDIDAGLLRVFEATPAGTSEICTYRFRYDTTQHPAGQQN